MASYPASLSDWAKLFDDERKMRAKKYVPGATYCVLDAWVHSTENPTAVNKRIASMQLTDRVAYEAIEFFKDRRGFDNWWDGILHDDQDELFDELRKRLKPALTPEAENGARA